MKQKAQQQQRGGKHQAIPDVFAAPKIFRRSSKKIIVGPWKMPGIASSISLI